MARRDDTAVVKIGTSSITDDEGIIDRAMVAKLCDEVAALRHWSPVGLLFPRGAQERAPLTRRQFNACRQAVEAMRVERTGL